MILTGRFEPARQRQAHGLFGVLVELAAEATAHVRRHHARACLRDAARDRMCGTGDVGDLGCGVERVLAHRRVRHRQDAPGLYRVRDEPADLVALLDRHEVRVLEERGGRGPARGRRVLLEDPCCGRVRAEGVMHHRRRRCECLLDVGHRGERLVLHLHKLGRILRQGAALRHHHGDPVAHMACLVLGKRPVLAHLDVVHDGPGAHERCAELGAQVGAAIRRDAPRHGERLRDIHAGDGGVGEGAADDVGPQHPRDGDVVHEGSPPGDELGVLLPCDRLSDEPLFGSRHRRLLRLRPRPERP